MDGIELYRHKARCPQCRSEEVKIKSTVTNHMSMATIITAEYECQNDCGHKFKIHITIEGHVIDITLDECF